MFVHSGATQLAGLSLGAFKIPTNFGFFPGHELAGPKALYIILRTRQYNLHIAGLVV